VTLELALHLAARRHKQTPAFALFSRALARALDAGSADPLGEALGESREPIEELLFAARMHGVAGVVPSLDGAGRLPPALLESFASDLARSAARAERLGEDLAALGARAERSSLSFVPLKGAVLAALRYRDAAQRPRADIDLLAADGQFDAWSRLLAELGYERQTESARDRVFQKPGARMPDSYAEDADFPRPVELHRRLETRLLGRSFDLTEAYVRGLAPGRLHGAAALLPDDDALALHLLVHAGPDLVGRGLRLIQLHDFTTLAPGARFADGALELLGEAAWGLAALAVSALPRALPAEALRRFERAAPGPARRRAWRARPGLLTGEEERTVLLLAEMPLCRGARALAGRAADALPERSFLDRAYGVGVPVTLQLARYYRDRLFSLGPGR
jgi:hypothetical protein